MATDTPSGEDISSLAQRLASGQPAAPSLPPMVPIRSAAPAAKPTSAILTTHKAFMVDCKAGIVTVANKVANPFRLQADMAEALSKILTYIDGVPDDDA